MSTLIVDNIETISGDNFVSTQISAAKAWVNFNGQGTVSINKSFNVDSVTDLGVGLYQVNMTSGVFSNGNYAVIVDATRSNANNSLLACPGYVNQTPDASQCQIRVMDNRQAGETAVDPPEVSVVFFDS